MAKATVWAATDAHSRKRGEDVYKRQPFKNETIKDNYKKIFDNINDLKQIKVCANLLNYLMNGMELKKEIVY